MKILMINHIHSTRYLLWLILLLGVGATTHARQFGTPFFKNYSPNQYGASTQNWQALQDHRGIMYFSNNSCILEFDGNEWDQIYLPSQSTVRALAQSREGIIYVGAQGDLGYLSPTPYGNMEFISLLPKIPTAHRNFRDVWRIHATEEGVYFLTDYKLFLLQKDGSIKVWLPRRSFFLSFYVDGTLYVHEIGVGLMQLKNQGLELVSGGDKLKDKSVQSIIPYTGNILLVATGKDGLYTYDSDIANPQAIHALDVPVNSELKENIAYSLAYTNDYIVVGTLRNGVYLLDKEGNELTVINQSKGLQNNQVWSMQTDRQGGVWLCLNKGISRLELGTPITGWGIEEGAGKIFSVTRHLGKLHIASGQDISRYNSTKESFEPMSNEIQQAWDLYEFIPQNRLEKKILLSGTQAGIFAYEDNKEKRIEKTRGGYVLFASKKFPDHIFYGHPGGVGVIYYDNRNWQFLGDVQNIKTEVRSFAEDSQGNIWVGTKHKGVIRLHYIEEDPLTPQITEYDTSHGLPSMRDNYLFNANTKVMVGSIDGLYRYNDEIDKFSTSLMFGSGYEGGKTGPLHYYHSDEKSFIWATSEEKVVSINPRRPETGNQAIELARLPQMEVNSIWSEDHGKVIWIGGSEGLYRYEPEAKHPHENFTTHIRRVIINRDSVVFYGNHAESANTRNSVKGASKSQVEDNTLEIPYSDASSSISFQYSATYFDDSESNEFRYILEGNDQYWSKWSSKYQKEYTNLSPGKYTFKVMSRNIFGEESEETSYFFIIETPLYRTLWAYALYILIAGLIIREFIKARIELVVASKKRLQQIIDEQEIVISEKDKLLLKQAEDIAVQGGQVYQQQEELVTQRDYIEQQNKQLRNQNITITDSIRYAHSIQDGLLPFEERLSESLKEHFVLYKAKSIVSGDFYWFEQVGNKKIIALADCTGHGVAGALMSIMGISALNYVLLKSSRLTPSSLLDEMDASIQTVLRQKKNRHNKDYINMAICIWEERDNDTIQLTFAGAGLSMYYVQNEKIHEVQGDKTTIGGVMDGKKALTEHQLILSRGAALYLLTDGLAKQNNSDHQTIGSAQLMALIEEHSSEPMKHQEKFFADLLKKQLKGHITQKDDVTLFGMRL